MQPLDDFWERARNLELKLMNCWGRVKNSGIISKEKEFSFFASLREVIYVKKKQNWAKDRSLWYTTMYVFSV